MTQTALQPRIATRDDIPGIAAAMTRAFMDYPLMEYMIPDAAKRAEKLEAWHRLTLRGLWPEQRGEVRTTDDYAGASMWVRPGQWKTPVLPMLRIVPGMIRIVGLRSFLRTVRVLTAFEKRHPHNEHWHLALLGTDPPMQRKGVGAALMAEALERCDREGLPAYLETQKIDNVAYYRRFGFDVIDEMTVGAGERAVQCWFMWREPRDGEK
jgi:GNAT superfamily N-acetyltransferase